MNYKFLIVFLFFKNTFLSDQGSEINPYKDFFNKFSAERFNRLFKSNPKQTGGLLLGGLFISGSLWGLKKRNNNKNPWLQVPIALATLIPLLVIMGLYREEEPGKNEKSNLPKESLILEGISGFKEKTNADGDGRKSSKIEEELVPSSSIPPVFSKSFEFEKIESLADFKRDFKERGLDLDNYPALMEEINSLSIDNLNTLVSSFYTGKLKIRFIHSSQQLDKRLEEELAELRKKDSEKESAIQSEKTQEPMIKNEKNILLVDPQIIPEGSEIEENSKLNPNKLSEIEVTVFPQKEQKQQGKTETIEKEKDKFESALLETIKKKVILKKEDSKNITMLKGIKKEFSLFGGKIFICELHDETNGKDIFILEFDKSFLSLELEDRKNLFNFLNSKYKGKKIHLGNNDKEQYKIEIDSKDKQNYENLPLHLDLFKNLSKQNFFYIYRPSDNYLDQKSYLKEIRMNVISLKNYNGKKSISLLLKDNLTYHITFEEKPEIVFIEKLIICLQEMVDKSLSFKIKFNSSTDKVILEKFNLSEENDFTLDLNDLEIVN